MNHDPVPVINTNRLTVLYIIALAMVGLFTIIGQFAVQYFLVRVQGDARIVNIAGRQRMLSQRLPLLVETMQGKINFSKDVTEFDDQIKALRDEFELWKSCHDGLKHGSLALRLEGENSPQVKAMFGDIEPAFERFARLMTRFITESQSQGIPIVFNHVDRQLLLDDSSDFLRGMDLIVSQYEREAATRVNRLRRLESGLLCGTIIVLLAEGFLIFSPAIASLKRTFGALRTATNELQQAKQEAERASAAKTDFLAKVSHELRTPLYGLLGVLELVTSRRLPQSIHRKLALATEAAYTLRRLVDDLLDIGAIESNQSIQLDLQWISLESTVRNAVLLMSPIAMQQKLALRCEIDSAVPRSIKADGGRLKQVLTNLLQNGIRYTEKGEVVCRVRLHHSPTSNGVVQQPADGNSQVRNADQTNQTFFQMVTFEVSDTGSGIAVRDQQAIFESFVRLHAGRSVVFGNGLGLGLSICNAIVQAMGGTLELASVVGAGSTFRFTVPVECSRADLSIREADVSLPLSRNSSQRLHVLIVDDSKSNRLLMREFLKRWKISSRTARTLQSAERKLRASQFDVMLLDKQLPDGDGIEFMRRLQASSLAVPPTYLITADVGTTLQKLPADLKIAGVIHKPVSGHQLALALDELQAQIPVLNKTIGQSAGNSPSTPQDEFQELRKNLLQILRDQLAEEQQSILVALRNRDFQMIRLVSHRVRGSAANIQLDTIVEIASRMETASLNQDIDQLTIAINDLVRAHRDL